MTAKIIAFPIAHRPAPADVIEGEIVSEVPADAMPAGCDLVPAAANRIAHLRWKAPKTGKGKRSAKPAKRVETLAVTCVRVPRKHADLRRQVGVLVIDWMGKVPHTVTFDPSDESIPNIVAPVEGWNRGEEAIAVASDEGTWVFVPLPDPTTVAEE